MAIKIAGTEVINDNKRVLNNESLPDIRPSLLLDFANSKTLDPRITFARGSTATYWDGKTTAKAEENLIKYSQELDNAVWQHYLSSSVTANSTTAPDGTTTADTVTFGADALSNAYQIFSGPASGTEVTVSCYAKVSSGTEDFRLKVYDGADKLSSDFTATTTWQRFSYTVTLTGTQSQIGIMNKAAGGAGSIEVWGVQMEVRGSATAYTPTTSSPIVKYQPVLKTAASGEARFDHDPVTGESKGLLIEESRTNLATYSEDLSNYSLVNRASATTNTTVAPDGTLTADTLTEDTTASQTHYGRVNLSAVSGTTYTWSVFVKDNTRGYARVALGDGGVAFYGSDVGINVNLSDGTFTGGTDLDSSSVTDVGNGWWRISVTATANATTGGYGYVLLYNGSSITYTGDGYSSVFVWGAQLEAGSFPTSYIPTSGSTVTRSVDSASITGTNFSGFFNQNEGTVYLDYKTEQKTANFRVAAISDNSTNNRMEFAIASSSGNGPYAFFVREGDNQVTNSAGYTYTANTDFKVATAYKTDDTSWSNNGETPVNDITVLIPTVDRLYIGADGVNTSTSKPCCSIRKFAYYPKRLPNATLQAMTEA